jgi:hypothetical protein
MTISAAALVCLGASLWSEPAQAGKFPDYLKRCKKSQNFLQERGSYSVPAVGGGAGIVKIVAQQYDCFEPASRLGTLLSLLGMTDASGKEIVPFKYARILPFSTTGAVVIGHGDERYPQGLMYRTYIAGKGEGKERFDLQDVGMLQPDNGCASEGTNTTTRGVSAVIGELFYGVGKGKSHVTLFTPEGKARKLEYMGGDDMPKPAVQRVGDVLLARWRDEQGVARSGILDLDGRQIAPVLGNAVVWQSYVRDADGNVPRGCRGTSNDLFIEGPSLDRDPTYKFYGPLLALVGRDGQPVPLPPGAIGLFPVVPVESASKQQPNPGTDMWAVVFPNEDSFEFTLHVGTPSEALLAAETAPRYSTMWRSYAHGGLITVRAVADGRWRVMRSYSTMVLAEGTDAEVAFNGVKARLDKEGAAMQQELAAARARYAAEQLAVHRKNWEAARTSGRMCSYRVSGNNTREEIEEYINACGPGNFAGLEQLAREKGMPEEAISAARNEEWTRATANAKARASWEEQARVERQRNANKDPGASYYPGQWSAAINAAGIGVTESIKKSGENWLEQRQKQYNADWQRSQRAY